MQTKLAFIFVLHVVIVGFLLAGRGVSFRPRTLWGVLLYLFMFYVIWGRIFQANEALITPETTEN